MPTDKQHVQQAQHNIQFLKSFYSSREYNDWAITASFYTAVHIVENAIYLEQDIKYKGQKIQISHSDELPQAASRANIKAPENFATSTSPHTFRNILVKENFTEIADFYMRLYRESRNSRYKKYSFSDIEADLIAKISLREIVDWSNGKYSTNFSIEL